MCMVTESCALVGLEEVFVFMRVSDVIDAGFVWQGVFLCCPSVTGSSRSPTTNHVATAVKLQSLSSSLLSQSQLFIHRVSQGGRDQEAAVPVTPERADAEGEDKSWAASTDQESQRRQEFVRCLFLPVAFDLMRSGHMTDGLRAGWFPVSVSNRVILRLPANSHRADLKGRIWLYVFLMLRDGERERAGEV
ncbi:unnamed protein product [Leuciscus chuanchicus]